MPPFVVVASPRKSDSLRWLAFPAGGRLHVREAHAGLEAVEADVDFGPGPRRDGTSLLAPASKREPDHVRFEVVLDAAGFSARTLEGEGAAAPVVEADGRAPLGAVARALVPGSVLEVRPGTGALLLEADRSGDPDALVTALVQGFSLLDALPDRALDVLLATRAPGGLAPWREVDLALRERRSARALFLPALDDAARTRVERGFAVVLDRILSVAGSPGAPSSRTGRATGSSSCARRSRGSGTFPRSRATASRSGSRSRSTRSARRPGLRASSRSRAKPRRSSSGSPSRRRAIPSTASSTS